MTQYRYNSPESRDESQLTADGVAPFIRLVSEDEVSSAWAGMRREATKAYESRARGAAYRAQRRAEAEAEKGDKKKGK